MKKYILGVIIVMIYAVVFGAVYIVNIKLQYTLFL